MKKAVHCAYGVCTSPLFLSNISDWPRGGKIVLKLTFQVYQMELKLNQVCPLFPKQLQGYNLTMYIKHSQCISITCILCGNTRLENHYKRGQVVPKPLWTIHSHDQLQKIEGVTALQRSRSYFLSTFLYVRLSLETWCRVFIMYRKELTIVWANNNTERGHQVVALMSIGRIMTTDQNMESLSCQLI